MKMITKVMISRIKLVLFIACVFASACKKRNVRDYFEKDHGHLNQAKDYPADVALAWMKLHLELNRTSPVPLKLNGYRFMPYFGIALYESVVPGMPSFRSLTGQLTDLPDMPDIANVCLITGRPVQMLRWLLSIASFFLQLLQMRTRHPSIRWKVH